MISHKHRCIFAHVPKVAGKSIFAAFGLPFTARQYDNSLVHIEAPFGHQPLSDYVRKPVFSYFKFAFVRNPWDRLVSAFFYLNAGGCNEFDAAYRDAHLLKYGGDFSRFVPELENHLKAQHFRPQRHWLCDAQGSLLADFVGRYENLSDDFTLVAEKLSLPAGLSRLNASEHAPYRDCYTMQARDMVGEIYRHDIEMFGYAF